MKLHLMPSSTGNALHFYYFGSRSKSRCDCVQFADDTNTSVIIFFFRFSFQHGPYACTSRETYWKVICRAIILLILKNLTYSACYQPKHPFNIKTTVAALRSTVSTLNKTFFPNVFGLKWLGISKLNTHIYLVQNKYTYQKQQS